MIDGNGSTCNYKMKLLVLYQFLLCSVVILNSLPAATGKVWAFLAAGSNGYENYRHQADVCHFYQILKSNGMEKDQIIVMMADDIAYNEENPFPGTVINKPKGTNVYSGVQKDYTDDTVTPKNFLNILSGNKTAMRNIGNSRVIESGPEDIILVYFVDHGGLGVLYFGDLQLKVTMLKRTIQQMMKKNQFKRMFLFIEACNAGSMFDGLYDENKKIHIITTADANESSFGCYWDEVRGTFLADIGSAAWMHELEKENLSAISINYLYEKVREQTEYMLDEENKLRTASHVTEYGNLDLGITLASDVIKYNGTGQRKKMDDEFNPQFAIPTPDIPLFILRKKLENTHSRTQREMTREKIESNHKKRKMVRKTFEDIVLQLNVADGITSERILDSTFKITEQNLRCFENTLDVFTKACFNPAENLYANQFLHTLINICGVHGGHEERILRTVKNVCSKGDRITGTF